MLHRMDNSIESCDLKFASDESTGEFSGYGSVFGSTDLTGDTIVKGAFVDSIKAGMPKMFINHNHMMIPPGDWLDAKEDDIGLKLEGKIDMLHSEGPSLLSAMRRKAMEGLSTGAIKSTMKFTTKKDGGREITYSDLKEVSVVNFPMEQNAMIMAVKSEIESIESLKDVEVFLREAGNLSRSMAKAFISQCRPLYQREVDTERERKEASDAALKWLHSITNTG